MEGAKDETGVSGRRGEAKKAPEERGRGENSGNDRTTPEPRNYGRGGTERQASGGRRRVGKDRAVRN